MPFRSSRSSRPFPPFAAIGLLVVLAFAAVAWAVAGAVGEDVVEDRAAEDEPAGPTDATGAVSDTEVGSDDPGSDDDPPAGDASGTDDGPAGGDPSEADAPGDDAADVEPDERGRLVIQHTGDVNLDHGYVPVFRRDGPAAAWDGVRDVFARADLVMVNLECAASDGGTAQDKQFVFRCDLGSLPAMHAAGVDVATLANNHSGDHGIQAMVESVGNVEQAGMVAVGVGVDERDAYRPRIVEAAGWRVAVLGFGGVVPVPEWHARGDRPGQATGYDAARMAEAVRAAREQADVVVVTVHWGTEGALTPRAEDVAKARAVAAAGADVVFGHHAHRLQPVERVDGMAVFWNLGNFVWPRFSDAGARTAIAEWVLEPDGTSSACLLPVEIDAGGVPRPTAGEPDCA